MVNSPENIKSWLRESKLSKRTAYGYFAEYIYAITMSASQHDVESRHSGGVDFLIDGKIKLDVKSRVCLDSKLGQFEVERNRLAGVHYPHVVFYEEMVIIYDTESKIKTVIKELSWEEVSKIFPNYLKLKKRRLYIPEKCEHIKENEKVLENLVAYIKKEWDLKAKKVRRSSPAAMFSMNKSGWGPEAFYLYEKDTKANVKLVVLVYFEGEDDYEVCAYPSSLRCEIKWKEKPVGKNPNERMTFDPNKLDNKFRFKNIEQFKKEFPNRFPKEIV